MQTLKLTKKYETYTEYKDSGIEWLGKIPKEWEVRKGKFVFRNKKEINKGMKNDNVLSLTMNGVINRDSESNEGLLPSDYQTFQIFEKDDLVFKLIDLENYKTSRVGIVHEKGIMSSAYIRLEANKNYYSRYFFYLYYHMYIQGIYNFLGSGVRSTLNPTDLINMIIIIPSLEEQKKVVIVLDKKIKEINLIIEKKKKIIELLKEKRVVIINHAVTKGLDSKVGFIESNVDWIGKIPKGWEVRRVKEFFEIKRGRVISKEEMEEKYRYPVYSSQTKNDGCMGYIDTYDFDISALTWTTDGANAGTVFYRDGKFNCTNVCGVLIPRKDLYLKYFVYSIQVSATPNKRLDTNGYKIMSNEMKNISVVVPPERKQEEIALFLDKKTDYFDKVINNVEKSVELLQEFKSSLISNAVTGKIKI